MFSWFMGIVLMVMVVRGEERRGEERRRGKSGQFGGGGQNCSVIEKKLYLGGGSKMVQKLTDKRN